MQWLLYENGRSCSIIHKAPFMLGMLFKKKKKDLKLHKMQQPWPDLALSPFKCPTTVSHSICDRDDKKVIGS